MGNEPVHTGNAAKMSIAHGKTKSDDEVVTRRIEELRGKAMAVEVALRMRAKQAQKELPSEGRLKLLLRSQRSKRTRILLGVMPLED